MKTSAASVSAAVAAMALSTGASAQDQLWIQQFGSAQRDGISALTPDGAGGAFAAGGATDATGATTDAWIARFSSAGAQQWQSSFAGAAAGVAAAVAPDGAGGAFLAVPGATGGFAGFQLARYSSAGAELWVASGASGALDIASARAADGAGGVFVAGDTSGDLGGPGAGATDAWLARYDADGDQLWLIQFGSGAADSAAALAPDGAGGVIMAGFTGGDLSGAGSAGGVDYWIARYDSSGARQWLIQAGAPEDDRALALAPDGAGGAFIAGSTTGVLSGWPRGREDIWIARYDSAGVQQWIAQTGTSRIDIASALTPDDAGGVYIGGSTEGALSVGHAEGGADIWLARYSSDGRQLWSAQFGGEGDDSARGLAPDGAGGLLAAGATGSELAALLSGEADAWIARYGLETACYADCDGSGALDFFDFLCFQNAFATGDPYADCDATGTLDFFDFLCFQNAFAMGCP
ncbi:MAG: hypothetical protein ACF8R7_03810 [Phycisphaerales bacterium JB039]